MIVVSAHFKDFNHNSGDIRGRGTGRNRTELPLSNRVLALLIARLRGVVRPLNVICVLHVDFITADYSLRATRSATKSQRKIERGTLFAGDQTRAGANGASYLMR